jgi:hypothetical protein
VRNGRWCLGYRKPRLFLRRRPETS